RWNINAGKRAKDLLHMPLQCKLAEATGFEASLMTRWFFALHTAVIVLGLQSAQVRGAEPETVETVEVAGPLPATLKLSNGTGFVGDGTARLAITNYHAAGKQTDVTAFFPIYREGRAITTTSYYDRHAAKIFGKVRYAAPACDLALIELGDIPDH